MRSILVGALLVASSIAAADPAPAASTPPPAPDAKQMVTDDCAKARKAHRDCVLDMGKEDVQGATPTHDGISTISIVWQQLGSLIHIRKDFIAEIVKSAEDLD